MYEDYEDAHRRSAFISQVYQKDFAFGGKLNLCDLRILKQLWFEIYPNDSEVPRITIIQDFFRNRHIKYMYELKRQGLSPYALLEYGFRAPTINKYWDNRELAERIVGFKLP